MEPKENPSIDDTPSIDDNSPKEIIEEQESPKISNLSDDKIQNKKSVSTGMIVALVAAVAVAAFFAGSYFSNLDSDFVTKSDLDNAISKLESKIGDTKPNPAQLPTPINISADDDPVRGDPNAPISIIEFSDFQCPFCARFHVQTLPALLDQYIDAGKVNFIYRDFPIQSIHPNALPAAVASECADEQGKYWEYHDILFEKQRSWSNLGSEEIILTLSQYANELDLKQEQFDTCLETGKYHEEVQDDLRDGRSYGITGTPGFFIGNSEIGFVKLTGAQPFDSFKNVIESQLET